jgi:hypothetical protein
VGAKRTAHDEQGADVVGRCENGRKIGTTVFTGRHVFVSAWP